MHNVVQKPETVTIEHCLKECLKLSDSRKNFDIHGNIQVTMKEFIETNELNKVISYLDTG